MPCYGQFVNGFSAILAKSLVRAQEFRRKGLAIGGSAAFLAVGVSFKNALGGVRRIGNVS